MGMQKHVLYQNTPITKNTCYPSPLRRRAGRRGYFWVCEGFCKKFPFLGLCPSFDISRTSVDSSDVTKLSVKVNAQGPHTRVWGKKTTCEKKRVQLSPFQGEGATEVERWIISQSACCCCYCQDLSRTSRALPHW